MRRWGLAAVPILIAAGVLATQPAQANIYTWVDAKGLVNVSNLPPPEGVRILNDTPDPPVDPARDAAVRDAARQADMQALTEQVQQLRRELEQTRRDASAPIAYAPAPTVVYVAPPPSASLPDEVSLAQPISGCDYGFNCGFWTLYFPGYLVAGAPSGRHRGGGRWYAPMRNSSFLPQPPSKPPQGRPKPTMARR